VGAALGGAWYQLLRRPLPKTEGTIRVDGLSSSVEIRRDRWGVPQIRASSEHDLWFGQGFCHAQDRLWQMDLHRRIASGRLAEIAGADGLVIDRLFRTLGIRRDSVRQVEGMDAETRSGLDAFCAGVNSGAEAARALPFEFQVTGVTFEPWEPVDIELIGSLLAFGLSTNWESELLRADMARELGPELTARLDPRYPKGNPLAARPGEVYEGDGLELAEQIERIKTSIGLAPQTAGSNNWAVSGERSVTGAPLVAGDPHLHLSMPGIWYEQGLELGERFARGAVTAGCPGLMMGHNNDVAMTFTNTLADTEDLFVERLDGDRYLFGDEWRPLTIFEEEISVKGRNEPEPFEVRETHHGPIVNGALGADPDPPLALRWSALGLQISSDAQMKPWEPTSGAELVESARGWSAGPQNLVWADRHGSIGYKMIGRLPIRKGDCPDLPKPGWTGEYEWEGWVPYEEMPETRDPECGYLVTANNKVVSEKDFPHHITSESYDGYRAKRIEALILATDEHDLDSFERMQVDFISNIGIEVARRLSRLQPRDQREVTAIERLRSWDGDLSAKTVAGTIYQAFTLRLGRDFARAVIRDRDLSNRYLNRSTTVFLNHITSPWRWQSQLMDMWEEADDELIGRPWDEFVLDALRGALDDLTDRFGPDSENWQWGNVHRAEFTHSLADGNPLFALLFNRSCPIGGNQETVAQMSYDPNDPFKAVIAPGWRMVADLAQPARSRWQGIMGQSGQPASPHYDDLQRGWLEGTTQLMAGEGPWRSLTLEPVPSPQSLGAQSED
jgi:penicillin G amidase